jgi:hypothetical protein
MKEDTKTGCGISTLWFDAYSEFNPACSIHDAEFRLQEEGFQTKSRKEVDRMFLQIMLSNSKGKPLQVAKAYTYYGIVRLVGGLWW